MRIANLKFQHCSLDIQGNTWEYSDSSDCILIIDTVKLQIGTTGSIYVEFTIV